MLKPLTIALLLLTAVSFAQQQPQVRVNVLNVCSPSDAERQEISSALARLPEHPRFGTDFEVARGRSSMTDAGLIAAGTGAQMPDGPPPVSRWVRVRKEFSEGSPFSNVQYSFSVTEDRAVETLVFRVRDPKDLMLVSISESVSVGANPAAVVLTDTPADRIRLERFGKSSIAIARCKDADQSRYEPLFQSASHLLASYRGLLHVREIVPADLKRLSAGNPKANAPGDGKPQKAKSSAAKSAPERKP